jgi:hypothetical protein
MPPKVGPSTLSSHPRSNAFFIQKSAKEPANPKQIGFLGPNALASIITRRIGIKLEARTIEGAHIREAAAPINMLLRVIKQVIASLLFSQFSDVHGLASRN